MENKTNDCMFLLNFIDEVLFVVDENYRIVFINNQCKFLTGKSSDRLEGKKCYSSLFQNTEPCENCQLDKLKQNKLPIDITHDTITHRGFRKIYKARFIMTSSGNFAEILTDITENKKVVDKLVHHTKELKAKNVILNLQKKEIERKHIFLEKVLNSTDEGIMVVDNKLNIINMNYQIKELAGIKSGQKNIKCHHVYGFDTQCPECPYLDRTLYKSSRKVNGKNLTISFNRFESFMVESVRDTTRELYLIEEIKKQQKDLSQKQHQMSLLNQDLSKMNEKLKKAQEVIDDELRQVGEIQASLLPTKLPERDDYDFAAFYTPAEQAGGDYYDCIEMSNGYWGFAVADVSGHGIPAAVIMAITRAIMRSYTYDVISPSEALGMMNEILCENIYTNDFVTMFYTVMNMDEGILSYSSAGHNPLLFFDKSEMIVKRITAEGLFLGAFDEVEYGEGKIEMDEGDIAFMYTDGLVEAMNKENELYGYDRLISKLIMFNEEKCSDIINYIMDDVKEFCSGRKFDDDITIFIIKKTGGKDV